MNFNQSSLNTIKVAISIVNYTTGQLVVDCLSSLVKEIECNPNLDIHVYVVDNNSPDDSIIILNNAVLMNSWQKWVTIISQPINGGFSYGNNIAIKAAFNHPIKPDYVYLLNPDTLMHKKGISALVEFMQEHPKVGIGGGAMVNLDGVQQGCARRFPSVFSELDNGARLGLLSRYLDKYRVPMPLMIQSHSCDWVSGASMIIRRSLIEKIGLMDDKYFLYFEELDYCYQAKGNGFDVCYIAESMITHFEGASTEITKRKRRGTYWYDSRRRYFVKNYGLFNLIIADIFWGVGRLTFNLRRLFKLGSNFKSIENDPLLFAWDILIGDIRAIITGQIWQNKNKQSEKL